MKNVSRVQDIDDLTQEEIEDGANYYNVHTEKCRIEGETYPMFVAKIVNKLLANEMPFVLFIGKPGTGKTYGAAQLGYILTEVLNLFKGEYTPSQNIHYDNLPYLKSVLNNKNKVLHKPEINTTLHSLDYNDKGNREFEKMLNLARTFGNLITGDAQKLYRCDRAIRENHTFRIVAAGGENQYHWDVYYIERKEESESKQVIEHFLMRWKPEKPPEELQEFIDKQDEEWKAEAIQEGIKELEKEQKKEEEENSLTIA